MTATPGWVATAAWKFAPQTAGKQPKSSPTCCVLWVHRNEQLKYNIKLQTTNNSTHTRQQLKLIHNKYNIQWTLNTYHHFVRPWLGSMKTVTELEGAQRVHISAKWILYEITGLKDIRIVILIKHLNISGSRDVIDDVIIWSAMSHFLLVVNWYQVSISNRFQDICI